VSTDKFIEERKYLKGVTEKTLAWYGASFHAFERALETEEQVKQRIVELRQRGVKPVSVNTYLRCIKAYFTWQGKPCVWQLQLAHFGSLIWPTLGVDVSGQGF
jgi:hypothetical protein